MLSKRISHPILGSAFAVLFFAATLPSGAQNEARRDNSGRQLAVVVPGLPHPTAIPTVHYAKVDAHSATTGAASFAGCNKDDREEAFKGRIRSSISTPTELSPEIKQAVEKGAIAAQGLSKIAVRRVSDTAAWLGMLWREMNDYPRLSPGTPLMEPQPLGPMKPLSYSGKEHKLFFTNERRIKTVVGR